MQQCFQSAIGEQFARVSNFGPSGDKTEIPLLSMLNNGHLIGLTAQIVSQAWGGGRPKGQMQAHAAQVRVNDQRAAVPLMNDGLGEVGRHKGFPLASHCAGH